MNSPNIADKRQTIKLKVKKHVEVEQTMTTYLPKRPQVILLGNGINLAFNGVSWNDLLNSIAVEEYKDKKIDCPMPLKAILVTRDNIDKTLKNHIEQHREQAYGSERYYRSAPTTFLRPITVTNWKWLQKM